MKSMKGEVALNISADKAWQMYRDDEVITKINPQLLLQAHYLQGDGSPGSLRLFRLGSAIDHYVKESMEKIEKVEEGRSVTYAVVGGDLKKMYDPYRVNISFIPLQGKEKEQCIAHWMAEFQPLSPATPPPETARDAALFFLKSFDN